MKTINVNDQIETLIDNAGLTNLLDVIIAVCDDKAEHLRSNWQDEEAAETWDDASAKLALVWNYVRTRNL